MFLKKIKKKDNKFLEFFSLICFFLNFVFITKFKFDILFDNFIYKISYLDILTNKGIVLNNGDTIPFPYLLKFFVCISLFGSLSSLFFLLIKKIKYSVFFIFSILIPPLLLLFFYMSDQVKIDNFNFLLIQLFLSFFTIFLFLCMIGLETAFKNMLKLLTLICILSLLSMVIYLAFEGIPSIFEIGFFKFLFGTKWSPSDNLFGILSFILCSIVVTVGSVIIGGIVGILTSVFLVEFIPKKVANIINVFIKLSAGIPSILYGFFGMLVIVPMVKKVFSGNTTGDSLLTSIIMLSIMILPTIISISEEAIKAVPKEYLEASLSLGVSKIKSIFKIVLPEARKGIMSSIFLGIGRAIGETMAVIMVSGNAVNLPNMLKPARFLTTAMALEFSYASGLHRGALFAIGLVLLLIICIINITFSKVLKKQG